LIERHTGWRPASDSHTQFGHDPDRANDTEPWGVPMDHVAGGGLPLDEGLFLVLLGIRAMIAGDDDRWNRPFEMFRDGEHTSTWTHSEIAAYVRRQRLAVPMGAQREHTLNWPCRLAAAGLGLLLHDNRYGTDHHGQAFATRWQHALGHTIGTELAGDEALATAFYAAPQEPADARRLFDAGLRAIGLDRAPELPLRPSRAIGSSLVLAREWGLDDVADRLQQAIDASFEPTWDTQGGEFTWSLGRHAPRPLGQFSAFLAAGEAAGPGRWTRLSGAPLEPCPQLVGVDFPTMAFTRAEWVDGNLRLRLAPLRNDPLKRTGFRIIGAEPRNWDVHGIDGVSLDLSTTGLDVRVPLVAGDLELIRSSY
jgi:hypothetical protein